MRSHRGREFWRCSICTSLVTASRTSDKVGLTWDMRVGCAGKLRASTEALDSSNLDNNPIRHRITPSFTSGRSRPSLDHPDSSCYVWHYAGP